MELGQLRTRRRNNALHGHSSVAPEGLNGIVPAVGWDFDIGVGAGLVIGELDRHCLGGSSQHSRDGGQEAHGEGEAVDELHIEGTMELAVFASGSIHGMEGDSGSVKIGFAA